MTTMNWTHLDTHLAELELGRIVYVVEPASPLPGFNAVALDLDTGRSRCVANPDTFEAGLAACEADAR